MASEGPRGLAATAHYTAAVRARESARPDALFSDPWAAQLAGAEGFALGGAAWTERCPLAGRADLLPGRSAAQDAAHASGAARCRAGYACLPVGLAGGHAPL